MKLKYVFYIFFVSIWIVFRNNSELTESIYSTGIYPYIAIIQHYTWGWLPFSFGDIFYTISIGYILYFILRKGKNLWKRPLWFFDKLLFFVALVMFAFFFLWGFNYFRKPLSETLQIDTKYTEEELYKATQLFVNEANNLHKILTKEDSVKVDFTLSHKEIYKLAYQSYPLGYEKITDFVSIKSVKPSLYSTFLTYMGYSGYLNPFTNEAQVNGKLIGYSLPVTACHEIAHQMGYAAEDEANYLGYLSAQKSENQYFKYSASLFGLRYLLNEVYKVNPEKYDEFTSKVNKGIFKNYKEVREFWMQYENKAEPIFKASYDAFLKANKQQHGIQSYNLVVGLLIKNKINN
ncbi:DUF3810 domain-containing protein [Capnocytophaga canis]|uniref:DUF3810 domain-containing protein n=1 Tax=Capnocytophaga canis TaxID=1848903 RepID=UPI001562B350|nr:DUF3810 domain-containing protein [Capnocytophaga canis]